MSPYNKPMTAHQNSIMGIRPVFVALAFAHDIGLEALCARSSLRSRSFCASRHQSLSWMPIVFNLPSYQRNSGQAFSKPRLLRWVAPIGFGLEFHGFDTARADHNRVGHLVVPPLFAPVKSDPKETNAKRNQRHEVAQVADDRLRGRQGAPVSVSTIRADSAIFPGVALL